MPYLLADTKPFMPWGSSSSREDSGSGDWGLQAWQGAKELCARQGWAQQKCKRNWLWAWGSLWQALPRGGLFSGALLPANSWQQDPACCSSLPWGHLWVNTWQRTTKIIYCGNFLGAWGQAEQRLCPHPHLHPCPCPHPHPRPLSSCAVTLLLVTALLLVGGVTQGFCLLKQIYDAIYI